MRKIWCMTPALSVQKKKVKGISVPPPFFPNNNVIFTFTSKSDPWHERVSLKFKCSAIKLLGYHVSAFITLLARFPFVHTARDTIHFPETRINRSFLSRGFDVHATVNIMENSVVDADTHSAAKNEPNAKCRPFFFFFEAEIPGSKLWETGRETGSFFAFICTPYAAERCDSDMVAELRPWCNVPVKTTELASFWMFLIVWIWLLHFSIAETALDFRRNTEKYGHLATLQDEPWTRLVTSAWGRPGLC